MTSELWESAENLLPCFFSECESQFRFLEQEHGYTYLSGMVEQHQTRQIIRPYKKNQETPETFQAITRYEKDDHVLEITYGKKEFIIESYTYFDHVYRLTLCELLAAAKRENKDVKANRWNLREEQITEVIKKMAASFKENKDDFLNPNPKTIDRALTMRSKRIEQGVRDIYKESLKHISVEAARAFLKKDFKKVIELLTP